MGTGQAFLLGLMVAYTPGLLFLAWMLLPFRNASQEEQGYPGIPLE